MRREGGPEAMTDRDRLNAILQDIPGDAGSWQALADRLKVMVPPRAPTWTFELNVKHGDGTVDAATLGHARNMYRAIKDFAFVLGAAERGADPDIPF